MKSIVYNLNNAVFAIREDGWISFLKSQAHEILGFPCESYFVYEHAIKERNPADFRTSLEDFEEFIIRDKKEIDELESRGYKFGFQKISNKIALANRVIVHCVFVNKELAHVGRLGLTKKAKKYVDGLSYNVDFEHNEAVTGGTWTNPKFRGKGLMTYIYYQRFEFLRGLGVKTVRNAVDITNEASNKVHAKFEPKITSTIRYRPFLYFFKYWRETPVDTNQ
jgi:RimJ/RimL family protein N-acetyltransferase